MTCLDDARLTGNVSMFLGVETHDWSKQEFIDAANFAKQHGITTLFVKVAEVGSRVDDIWYGGMQGIIDVVNAVKSVGMNVITYQYLWADTNIDKDTQVAIEMLKQFGSHCLDIEGDTWTKAQSSTWAKELSDGLSPIPGKLWVSCPSDPGVNNQVSSLQALSPATNVFMPMMYDNALVKPWANDIQQINGIACVQPTLDLSQEFGTNDPLTIAKTLKDEGILAISLWEYTFFKNNPKLVDDIVSVFSDKTTQGDNKVPLNLSKYSTYGVCEVRLWWQLLENEPDLCGIATVVALDNSVAPNQPLVATPEDIDVLVDQICKDVFHIDDPKNFPGVSPSDMEDILAYVRDRKPPDKQLHWQVVPATLENIYAALDAGYPLAASWNEQDSTAWHKRLNTWVHATPWILSAGHVAPIIGYEPFGDKNLLVADQLNNSYQEYWPPVYSASGIAKSLSWLSIIKTPWLQPMPDADPKKWPANFNAQSKGITPPMPTPPTDTRTNFEAETMACKIPGTDVNSGIGKWLWNEYQQKRPRGPYSSAEFNIKMNGKPAIGQIVGGSQIVIWQDSKVFGIFPYHVG